MDDLRDPRIFLKYGSSRLRRPGLQMLRSRQCLKSAPLCFRLRLTFQAPSVFRCFDRYLKWLFLKARHCCGFGLSLLSYTRALDLCIGQVLLPE